jgi:hypothetical protein
MTQDIEGVWWDNEIFIINLQQKTLLVFSYWVPFYLKKEKQMWNMCLTFGNTMGLLWKQILQL